MTAARETGLSWTSWQKSLIEEPSARKMQTPAERIGRIQHKQSLLAAASESAERLIGEIRQAVDFPDPSTAAAPTTHISTSGIRCRMYQTEQLFHDELADRSGGRLTRRAAAEPYRWFEIVMACLERGVIDDPPAEFLRAVPDDETILTMPPSDIFEDAATDKNLDAATRRLLRSTGGVFVRKGSKFVEDCPLAAAWWRTEIALECAQHSELHLSRDEAHRLLCLSGVWAALRQLFQEQASRLLAPQAKVALMLHLRDLHESGAESPGKSIASAAKVLAARASRVSLHHLEIHEVSALLPSTR